MPLDGSEPEPNPKVKTLPMERTIKVCPAAARRTLSAQAERGQSRGGAKTFTGTSKSPRKKVQSGGSEVLCRVAVPEQEPAGNDEERKSYTLQLRLLRVLQPVARAISLRRR